MISTAITAHNIAWVLWCRSVLTLPAWLLMSMSGPQWIGIAMWLFLSVRCLYSLPSQSTPSSLFLIIQVNQSTFLSQRVAAYLRRTTLTFTPRITYPSFIWFVQSSWLIFHWFHAIFPSRCDAFVDSNFKVRRFNVWVNFIDVDVFVFNLNVITWEIIVVFKDECLRVFVSWGGSCIFWARRHIWISCWRLIVLFICLR